MWAKTWQPSQVTAGSSWHRDRNSKPSTFEVGYNAKTSLYNEQTFYFK